MTLSTSTVTLAPGNFRTYTLAPGEAVTVATAPNCYVTVTETPDVISSADLDGQTNVRTSILQYKGEWTYGPYALGGTVAVAVSLSKSTSSVSVTLGSAAAAVVGAAGISLEYGDSLTSPSSTTALTAAISTTATLSATAISTYRKARVSWLNNGASGTAKLYISINAENDVQGLVACNNARRRDHEMTIGDCIMLVCDEPITRLNFTSDTSISSNTHRLVITFGE